MHPTVNIQELAIVVAVRNHNPTLLTPDFLKCSGIVPTDWELARQPISTNRVAQVVFQNGISLVAEPTRIVFWEAMTDKTNASILVPAVARNYVQTLPKADYQALGLNLVGYATFNNQPEAASQYLAATLLSPGPWQEVGTAPARATVNYAYTLERSQFNLSVSEAALRLPEETTTPIVLFSGNFSYDIANLDESQQLPGLYQALENWQADLETYKDIVNTKFLSNAAAKAIVPNFFPTNPVLQFDDLQPLPLPLS